MKVVLCVVGKTTNPHVSSLVDDYLGRINRYVPFSLVVIPALRATRALPEQQQREREGEKILRLLLPNDCLVILDERGTQYDSIALARWLQRKQQTAQRLVFVVGGPYGFSPAVYARADEQLSLSSLTLSHQLVRVFFVEQLYRACTIIKGEPYHHS